MVKKLRQSLKEWCELNNRQELLDRWDYNLNKVNPEEVSSYSNTKRWFKCPKGIHKSELYDIDHLCRHPNYNMQCRACNSFAQYIIDKYDINYLNYIWSDKNIKSPWDYTHGSNQLAWFNCTNNSDHVYQQVIYNRVKDCLCPFCNNKNINTGVAKGHSLAEILPESINVWSDKNTKTPYDYTPSSGMIVWWKCENNIHDDYERKIANSNIRGFKCPICVRNNQVRLKGKNHPNWKGTTPENVLARMNLDYKNWRQDVYARDGYLCQCCLNKTHDRLQAHHIYSFALYPNLRYEIYNGITLCDQCHDNHFKGSFHQTYGTLDNTPEQLEEYINRKRQELGITEPFNIYDYMSSIEDDDLEIDDTQLDLYE